MHRFPTLAAWLASAGLASAASGLGKGPLADPAIVPDRPLVRVEPNQRMLTLTAKGDPDCNGDSAMAELLRHFFKGGGEAEKNAPVRPRVRWLLRSPSIPREAWVATYAVPVSESFPAPAPGSASIAEWRYGLIAEWAYAGPYERAQPAIDSLKGYISANGFVLIGELEEEYVRGRGTLYRGYPAEYLTTIRYRVHAIRDWVAPAYPLSSNP